MGATREPTGWLLGLLGWLQAGLAWLTLPYWLGLANFVGSGSAFWGSLLAWLVPP